MKRQVSPTVTMAVIVVAVLVLAGLIWKLTSGSGFHPTLDKIPGEQSPGGSLGRVPVAATVPGEAVPGGAGGRMPGSPGSAR